MGEIDLHGDIVALSPYEGIEQEPPQWVIMGVELHGRYAVLASDKLTRAEMRRKAEEHVVKRPYSARPVRLRKETTAVGFICEGFTMIYGATYAECMASLAQVWQPPEAGRPSSVPEIEQ